MKTSSQVYTPSPCKIQLRKLRIIELRISIYILKIKENGLGQISGLYLQHGSKASVYCIICIGILGDLCALHKLWNPLRTVRKIPRVHVAYYVKFA